MLPPVSLESRLAALAAHPCLRVSAFGAACYGAALFPLSAVFWGDLALPAVVLAAGVHGDEPEGVEAALGLLESVTDGAQPLQRHRLIVLPCLNPSGLADGTRANRAGQDINRQFDVDSTPETAAVRAFLRANRPEVLVDLHTDAQAEKFYVIELMQSKVAGLGEKMRTELTAQQVPLEPAPRFGACVGRDGLIAPTPRQIQAFERRASGMALTERGWQHGVSRNYILATPRAAGFARGAALHRAALIALLAALESEPGRGAKAG